MRILTKGTLPAERVYRAICQHCKCHFEFQQKEAKMSRDPREGPLLTIKCPTSGCGYTIHMDGDDYVRD